MRICNICQRDLSEDSFFREKRVKSGLTGFCKECKNQRQRLWRRTNIKREMLRLAKDRARRLGLEFSLTIDDFSIPERCPILGIPLEFTNDRATSPSLDRINPKLGYTQDNIQVISFRANWMKGTMTMTELRQAAEQIIKNVPKE